MSHKYKQVLDYYRTHGGTRDVLNVVQVLDQCVSELGAAKSIIAVLLEEAKDSLEQIGDCDHSVGICCCQLKRRIETAETFLREDKGTTALPPSTSAQNETAHLASADGGTSFPPEGHPWQTIGETQ